MDPRASCDLTTSLSKRAPYLLHVIAKQQLARRQPQRTVEEESQTKPISTLFYLIQPSICMMDTPMQSLETIFHPIVLRKDSKPPREWK